LFIFRRFLDSMLVHSALERASFDHVDDADVDAGV
jgi:hypothetical protein